MNLSLYKMINYFQINFPQKNSTITINDKENSTPCESILMIRQTLWIIISQWEGNEKANINKTACAVKIVGVRWTVSWCNSATKRVIRVAKISVSCSCGILWKSHEISHSHEILVPIFEYHSYERNVDFVSKKENQKHGRFYLSKLITFINNNWLTILPQITPI